MVIAMAWHGRVHGQRWWLSKLHVKLDWCRVACQAVDVHAVNTGSSIGDAAAASARGKLGWSLASADPTNSTEGRPHHWEVCAWLLKPSLTPTLLAAPWIVDKLFLHMHGLCLMLCSHLSYSVVLPLHSLLLVRVLNAFTADIGFG